MKLLSCFRGAAALTFLLLASVVGIEAQNNANSPAPVTKLGVLNVRQAIISTAEGKQAQGELQSQFSGRQNELEGLRKQIEEMQSRFRSIERTGSDEEKARLQRQGDLMSRQFQRKQDELQEDLNAAQGEVIDRIGRKMLEVLDRYARENGYVLVIDSSNQTQPVVYFSSQVDVTQDIIRLYDQAYPVKGAAAPARPQPSQPRPTPPAKPPAQPAKPPAQPPKPPQK